MNLAVRRSALGGFTLVELMIVVAIIGLLASVAIPHWIRARELSRTTLCIANLREIDRAKQQWALEFKRAGTATPLDTDIANYIGRAGGALPVCPIAGLAGSFGTSYTINPVDVIPACQIDSANHKLP